MSHFSNKYTHTHMSSSLLQPVMKWGGDSLQKMCFISRQTEKNERGVEVKNRDRPISE